jgi:hypothetical protein
MKLGKISVGTVWNPLPEHENVYIGRSSKAPSPLGNPFVINANRTRDEACDQYEEYLMKEMNQGNRAILDELNHIGSMVLEGKQVNLLCYCSGKRCHGAYIRDLISEQILEYEASKGK